VDSSAFSKCASLPPPSRFLQQFRDAGFASVASKHVVRLPSTAPRFCLLWRTEKGAVRISSEKKRLPICRGSKDGKVQRFLRQQLINETWEVGYSPIIDASTSHVPSDPADLLVSPIISTRQSFFYLASLAEKRGPVVNQILRIPGPAWQCDKGVYMFYLTSLRQMR
jgi:hypothetical protein